MEVLSVNNVKKSYGSCLILDEISFSVNNGEVVGYLGPNGSGKSTTINLVTGLKKPDTGKIFLLGQDVTSQYEQVFPKVGTLFDTNGLYEKLTAEQNLIFYMKACSQGMKYSYSVIDAVLKDIGLEKEKNKKVKTFSKGMKRKLALARSLMMKPKILLLDEPFDGIDIEYRAKLIQLIKRYNKEYNMSILMTSHVMADIEELAERIIVLNNKKIVINTSMESFRNFSKMTQVRVTMATQEDLIKYIHILKTEFSEINVNTDGLVATIWQNKDRTLYIKELLIQNNINFLELYNIPENISDIYLRMVSAS